MKLIPGKRKSPRLKVMEALAERGEDPDRLATGLRHLRHQLSQLVRLETRRSRTPKPAPKGRAELVAKQKKARPVYRRK